MTCLPVVFSSIAGFWSGCAVFQYKVLLYSLDGRLLSSYRAYEWPLGIKSIAWSPSSQFLAIGSFDEKVRSVSCLFYLNHLRNFALTVSPCHVS